MLRVPGKGWRPLRNPLRAAVAKPPWSWPGMIALYLLINTILDLFFWVLILSAILSWLVAFNIVNTRNRAVYLIGDFLYRITEPVLRPIRRVLPNLGGLDLSPIVVLLAISFIQNLMAQYWPRF
jgi:YggT family protein